MRAHSMLAAIAAAGLSATPVLAQGPVVQTMSPGHWGGPFGQWYGGWQPQVMVTVPAAAAATVQPDWQGGYDREGWLRECRHRLGDTGVGGAIIGGVVGGVAGNAIAGSGNRTVGTVAGAAVGAVAGAAIDRAEDRARVQDRCEAMLAAPPGGYGVPMMLMPVVLVPAGPVGVAQQAAPPAGPAPASARPCKETVVTEEYYETVPRRARFIPRRAPDKRIPQ